jgi:hypothetical protein
MTVMTIPHRYQRAAALLGTGLLLIVPGCTAKPAPSPIQTAEHRCPQWADSSPDRHSNADAPYLGCISAANLRAMVANPADLERGRPLFPANGERESLAVEAYQQGKVKPFQGASASGAGSTQSGSSGSSGGSP